MRTLALVVVVGCGSSPAPEPIRPSPVVPVAVSGELSPALAPLQWWLGDWAGKAGSEHWIAANGAIYGVALGANGFEVMIVDDGEGTAPADGVLRLIAMPGGMRAVEFRTEKTGEQTATFANPAHDEPKAITYARDGKGLRATLHRRPPTADGVPVSDSRDVTFSFAPGSRETAPELEAADRAFAADTAARGIDGWMAAFEPKGGMIRKGARIEGDAIRETMAPLLASGKLAWDPIASGKQGDLGFTVGKATFTGASEADSWASSYVTIWRRQADGAWKVTFDVGRPVNRPAP